MVTFRALLGDRPARYARECGQCSVSFTKIAKLKVLKGFWKMKLANFIDTWIHFFPHSTMQSFMHSCPHAFVHSSFSLDSIRFQITHHLLIHSFIHSLIDSFLHSFTHSLFHSVPQWFIDSFLGSLIRWFWLFIDSSIHWLVHSLMHWLMETCFDDWLMRWILKSLMHPFLIQMIPKFPFIDSLIHCFRRIVQSLIHWLTGAMFSSLIELLNHWYLCSLICYFLVSLTH